MVVYNKEYDERSPKTVTCKGCGVDVYLRQARVHARITNKYCRSCKDHPHYGKFLKAAGRYNLHFSELDIVYNMTNCQICETVFTEGTHKGSATTERHIDHCHTTGAVRGVICARCNLALGSLGDTVEGIQRALDYIKGEYYEKSGLRHRN